MISQVTAIKTLLAASFKRDTELNPEYVTIEFAKRPEGDLWSIVYSISWLFLVPAKFHNSKNKKRVGNLKENMRNFA